MNHGMVDSRTLCRKLIKILLQGAMVMFATIVLSKKEVSFEQALAVGIVASSLLAVFELFETDQVYSHSLKQGIGLASGVRLMGGL